MSYTWPAVLFYDTDLVPTVLTFLQTLARRSCLRNVGTEPLLKSYRSRLEGSLTAKTNKQKTQNTKQDPLYI